MPKLKKKWNEITESTGGFADIEPGAYRLVITGFKPFESNEFVSLQWDVAEGPAKFDNSADMELEGYRADDLLRDLVAATPAPRA